MKKTACLVAAIFVFIAVSSAFALEKTAPQNRKKVLKALTKRVEKCWAHKRKGQWEKARKYEYRPDENRGKKAPVKANEDFPFDSPKIAAKYEIKEYKILQIVLDDNLREAGVTVEYTYVMPLFNKLEKAKEKATWVFVEKDWFHKIESRKDPFSTQDEENRDK